MQPGDEVARMIAHLDQYKAAWRDYATMVHGLYAEFVLAGFTPDQAMELVMLQVEMTHHDPPG